MTIGFARSQRQKLKFFFRDRSSKNRDEVVWDFKRINQGIFAEIRYYTQKGKTLQIVDVEKWTIGQFSHNLTNIDCKECWNQWKIEEGIDYNNKFCVLFGQNEETGIDFARKVSCKNCNYVYILDE